VHVSEYFVLLENTAMQQTFQKRFFYGIERFIGEQPFPYPDFINFREPRHPSYETEYHNDKEINHSKCKWPIKVFAKFHSLEFFFFTHYNSFLDQHYDISDVDTARTNKDAFSAQHAFVDFQFKVFSLALPEKKTYFSDIEIDKIVCAACCRTTTARQTS
jgi:hypothetical protein